jgi:hypothetical protein
MLRRTARRNRKQLSLNLNIQTARRFDRRAVLLLGNDRQRCRFSCGWDGGSRFAGWVVRNKGGASPAPTEARHEFKRGWAILC